jgi:uncharacterized Zn finger protein
MRIDSAKAQNHLQKYKRLDNHQESGPASARSKLEDKVEISSKKPEQFRVANNSPNDPTVPTKVLDSLNLGMINFNQQERDTLATIMSEKATQVRQKNDAPKVEAQVKKIEHLKVEKNSPNDPTVSTNVLDSLNLGMINFNQKERDTLATIMANKATKVSEKISKT